MRLPEQLAAMANTCHSWLQWLLTVRLSSGSHGSEAAMFASVKKLLVKARNLCARLLTPCA